MTTTLDKSTTILSDIITFSGITSFFGADYIGLDADTGEIMNLGVGIGTTNGIKVKEVGWELILLDTQLESGY